MRGRKLDARRSVFGPLGQSVGPRRLGATVLDIVRTVEFSALPCVDVIRFAASGNFAFATNHRDAARVSVFIDVDSESASLLYGKREIGCINFVQISLAQIADAEIDGAFGEAHLDDVFIEG